MIKTAVFSILLVFTCSYGSFLFFKSGHPELYDVTYWQIYSGYERSNPRISLDDSGIDEFVDYLVVSNAQWGLDRIKPKVFAVTGFAMLLGIILIIRKYRKENKPKTDEQLIKPKELNKNENERLKNLMDKSKSEGGLSKFLNL